MAIKAGLRRIQVALDPGVDAALSRIGAHQGRPIATLIRELLREGEPAFKSTADALDLVRTNPRRALAQMVALSACMLEDTAKTVEEESQAVRKLLRKRGRKPRR